MRHAHTGGTERHLNQVALHLAAAGHEVTILCRSHEEPPHPRVQFEVLRPLAIGATWRAASFARAVQHYLERASFDVVYGLGRTWTQDALRLGGGSHATYMELAHDATRVGIKGLTSLLAPKNKFNLFAERRALLSPSLRKIVVNARMVQDDISSRYGLPPERFELIYNGVDLERFSPRHRMTAGARMRSALGLAPTTPAVLFLGSGFARKGLDRLLHALARSRRRDAHLIVVGYDSAEAMYQSLAKSLGLAERTRFLGGRRDTEACYAAADLYVLPTRYDPFANTTLEALASGLPVITSQTNGACELINTSAGSVYDVHNDDDLWSEAIDSWLEPKALSLGGQAARALAEQHSIESKMEATSHMLESMAGKHAHAKPTS